MRNLISSSLIALGLCWGTGLAAQDAAIVDTMATPEMLSLSDALDAILAGDYSVVERVVRPLAEAGNLRALNMMGGAYENGWGVPVEADLALEYYRRAAEGGYPLAMFNLGFLYGGGVPDLMAGDLILARAWYGRAAALDYGPAIGNYGVMLFDGAGGPTERERARAMFERGADLGDPVSVEWLAYFLSNGIAGPRDDARARALYEQVAARGVPTAMTALGIMIENGSGGPVDIEGASYWYRRAAHGGDGFGAFFLAGILADSLGVYEVETLSYCLRGTMLVDYNAPDAAEWHDWCSGLVAQVDDQTYRVAQKAAERMGMD